jgi:hypothetical protein
VFCNIFGRRLPAFLYFAFFKIAKMVPKKIIGEFFKHASKKRKGFKQSEMFFVDSNGKLKQTSKKDELIKMSKCFHEFIHTKK